MTKKVKNLPFNNYKFRCSSLSHIMGNLYKGELNQTAKTYLLGIYIKQIYGREREVSSKFMDKGNYAELTDSLDIVSEHYNQLFTSKDLNKDEVSNDYLIGHIDLNVLEDRVIDIKSSWDMQSFFSADGTNKDYEWQMWAYMWLTGKKQADLAYCLANAPAYMIENEHRKKMYTYKHIEGTDEYDQLFDFWADFYDKNMKFDDIPMHKRIRVFPIMYDASKEKKVIERIELCRNYLNDLYLSGL